MANVVLGVFSERDRAEEAISELEEEGYNPKDMSIIMKDRFETREFQEDTGAGNVVGGAVGGAATGAVLGGLAGLVASFIIPGLDAFFIGGPLAAALGLTGAAATTASGAATGALAGGIIGALTSAFGLSTEEARVYEDRLNKGGILIAVPVRAGHEQEVEEIMSDLDADNIKTVSAGYAAEREEKTAERYGPAYMSEIGFRRHRPTGSKRRSR